MNSAKYQAKIRRAFENAGLSKAQGEEVVQALKAMNLVITRAPTTYAGWDPDYCLACHHHIKEHPAFPEDPKVACTHDSCTCRAYLFVD